MTTWSSLQRAMKKDPGQPGKIFQSKQQKMAPYIFISPFYLIFAVFFLLPSIAAILLSVFDWNGMGALEFVGLNNYIRLFGDKVFWQAVLNTSIYSITSLFIVVPLGLVLAVLLNSDQLKLKTLWRALYYTPAVTSSVAIAIVFQLLYSQESGLINAALTSLGMQAIPWLSDQIWVKIAISILIIWRSTGLISMYFLAGLQGIEKTLYEAASIDGASGFQQFVHITVPMLKPIMLFVSILATLSSIQIFDEPNILTQGGPANASLSVVQYLYLRGFTRLRFGFASSVGTVLFVVVFLLSLLQMKRFGTFKEN